MKKLAIKKTVLESQNDEKLHRLKANFLFGFFHFQFRSINFRRNSELQRNFWVFPRNSLQASEILTCRGQETIFQSIEQTNTAKIRYIE